jgi:tetratricopeptide (TPR) repeat protein
MSMISYYVRTRAFQISVLILVVVSIICARIPLLNYLGFEFSVLIVLVAGFVSGILTLALWCRSGPEEKSDAWKCIGDIAAVQLVLLAIPLLISLGNALLVKNCSIGNGLQLYALIVVPGVLLSMSIALLLGVLFKKWKKIAFTAVYVMLLLQIPIVTILRPQIFAFNPLLGYFPGITYDEALQITHRLFIYRLATVAGSAFLIATTLWIWGGVRRLSPESIASIRDFPVLEWGIMALAGPVVVVVFALSDRMGLSSSEEFIKQKLGGDYRTAHFDIVYPLGAVKRETVEQLGVLHEFHYAGLCRELAVKPVDRISSFIYASAEQKGRLIGAMHTDISKPWLREMHINLEDAESVLKHEMTHVLAAEFGWSPLKIAPNSGLIEGLAVAMQETAYEEPLDKAAGLALAAGADSSVERLFSLTGFAQANAGVSYTLAGSFCSYLIRDFGIERFKRLYQTGRFSELGDVGKERLFHIWIRSVRKVPLNSGDSIKAKYLFRRPSIFGKECARVLANLNVQIRDLLARRDFEEVLTIAERSLALSHTPQAVIQKATALFEMRRFKEFVSFAATQMDDKKLAYALLPLHLRLGDAYWTLDSLTQAKHEYETLAKLRIGSRYEEACAVRLEALSDLRDRNELGIYFSYATEDTVRIVRLEQLTGRIAGYLLAREYAAKKRFRDAARVFGSLGPMRSKTLEFFRLSRLGETLFQAQEYDKAKDAFGRSLQIAPTAYLHLVAEEWIQRCRFWPK